MAADQPVTDDRGGGRSAHRLQQIADALGLPLDAFRSGGGVAAEMTQRCELLRLWSELDRPRERQRVLEFMRDLADGAEDR